MSSVPKHRGNRLRKKCRGKWVVTLSPFSFCWIVICTKNGSYSVKYGLRSVTKQNRKQDLFSSSVDEWLANLSVYVDQRKRHMIIEMFNERFTIEYIRNNCLRAWRRCIELVPGFCDRFASTLQQIRDGIQEMVSDPSMIAWKITFDLSLVLEPSLLNSNSNSNSNSTEQQRSVLHDVSSEMKVLDIKKKVLTMTPVIENEDEANDSDSKEEFENILEYDLLLNDIVLDSKATLESLGINHKNSSRFSLFLKKKSENRPFYLRIHHRKDVTQLNAEVTPKNTIAEVKQLYHQQMKLKCKPSELELVIDGHILNDSDSLADHSVSIKSQPMIFVRIPEPNKQENSNSAGSARKLSKPEKKQVFIKRSAIKKKHYSTFTSIAKPAGSSSNSNSENNAGNNNQSAPEVVKQKARKLTEEILSSAPSGDPSQRDTLLHILSGIASENGQECVFFDSSKGMTGLTDTVSSIVDAPSADAPPQFVVTFDNLSVSAGSSSDEDDDDNEDQKTEETALTVEEQQEIMVEIQECIENQESHSVLEAYRKKLSIAHGVNPEQIQINDVCAGSFIVDYTVLDLTQQEKLRLAKATASGQLSNQMQKLFNDYRDMKIHPLLFQPSYTDISMFDERGNKTFTTGQTYKVGPANKQQDYIQPTGWTRYGLRVLGGKYGTDDRWLTPFQDAGNWYRAYHGTANAVNYYTNNNIGKNAVDAMADIYNGGFHMAHVAACGPGVYASPDPVWQDNAGYAGRQSIQTQQGTKNFRFMFQVAINPNAVTFHANNKIWVAKSPADIRAYGILIKEI